ncbi:MAG: alpha/beta hydrolase [Acidobacteriota bacterium]|nr:alpha/beta hydrolase [Acidobacteriota bacterium]
MRRLWTSRIVLTVVVLCLFSGSPLAAQLQPGAAAVEEGENWELGISEGSLFGTLLVPEGLPPYPVALIIAGSGPTDRNGNNPLAGENNSLRYLAEGLAAAGIASLRYDKRMIGDSAGLDLKESDVVFDDFVSDASQWVERLRGDSRFSSVTVIGHSEGSLVGMLAVRRASADAFVSIAGPGRPLGALLREQLEGKLPPKEAIRAEEILTSLERGESVAKVPNILSSLFRPSVQPFLISMLRYDPTKEIAKLEVPTLIVQGNTDIQVPVQDALALKQAAPEAEFRLVDGMNHVLKSVPSELAAQQASYGDPKLPLAEELLGPITELIGSLSTLPEP